MRHAEGNAFEMMLGSRHAIFSETILLDPDRRNKIGLTFATFLAGGLVVDPRTDLVDAQRFAVFGRWQSDLCAERNKALVVAKMQEDGVVKQLVEFRVAQSPGSLQPLHRLVGVAAQRVYLRNLIRMSI